MKVYFIGAGPGDPELLTIKGKRILEQAQVVIYAGSLVNKALLQYASPEAEVYNSAGMHLDEMVEVMVRAVRDGKMVARLHTGDPSLYGAIQEQMAALEEHNIPYEVVPGVSSFLAAAASLRLEFTQPGGTQTVIISRLSGRTPVPEKERLGDLARHKASLCLFLSVHKIEEVVSQLREGYPADTPVAVVYKASWPEEVVIRGTLETIAELVKEKGIERTALVIVGECLAPKGERSRLYDPAFSHGYRRGSSG
ncbi:precorrin-4 C(11)-methyltransferase [Calderihabitans maritimus]|uniref:Precorrin-4 C(11)-methyltransferase n=1 Tax=Calderihabitans maritimus TaxID=1246530 RepID=A0A1Z5HQE1_9FIRM|nr:precorrin-4 C(11)-methyltransferase [Calderihabitans maritimus]GAW91525.1 precorrin-4 C(11)-methyltransferase [Calderihabitans maritimus]